MNAQATKIAFKEIIEKLPNLPDDIRADITANHRFQFVFMQVMSDMDAFDMFSAAAGIQAQMNVEDSPAYVKRAVALTPEQMTTLVVYLYRNLYLRVRDEMAQIEKEAIATAAVGRA